MKPSPPLWRSIAVPLAALCLPGCSVVEDAVSLPVKAVQAVLPGSSSPHLDPATLQSELQRFADEFTSQTNSAIGEYANRVGTEEARSKALRWKLVACTSAFNIASGPNPIASVLDFAALTTLTRACLEEHWAKTEEGEAFQPWIEATSALETEAWELAGRILKPEQLEELREAIQRWQEANPDARTAFFARPQELISVVQKTDSKGKERFGSVLGLIGLDPTAGLDPAVREVTRTRLFAERALFSLQRLPYIVRMQVEVLADRLASGDEAKTVVGGIARLSESVDRFSRATESASQTAAELPDRIASEREAILAALDPQEGKLRELSAEVGRTLAAGEKMSASLNTTVVTFDALMKRFGVGEPEAETPPYSDEKPFDILDYERTAEQLAVTARELNTLLKEAERTLDSPALQSRLGEMSDAVERAGAEVRSLLVLACILAAGLAAFVVACALAYRWLAPRERARPGDWR